MFFDNFLQGAITFVSNYEKQTLAPASHAPPQASVGSLVQATLLVASRLIFSKLATKQKSVLCLERSWSPSHNHLGVGGFDVKIKRLCRLLSHRLWVFQLHIWKQWLLQKKLVMFGGEAYGQTSLLAAFSKVNSRSLHTKSLCKLYGQSWWEMRRVGFVKHRWARWLGLLTAPLAQTQMLYSCGFPLTSLRVEKTSQKKWNPEIKHFCP